MCQKMESCFPRSIEASGQCIETWILSLVIRPVLVWDAPKIEKGLKGSRNKYIFPNNTFNNWNPVLLRLLHIACVTLDIVLHVDIC